MSQHRPAWLAFALILISAAIYRDLDRPCSSRSFPDPGEVTWHACSGIYSLRRLWGWLVTGVSWAMAYSSVGNLLGAPPPHMGTQQTSIQWHGLLRLRRTRRCGDLPLGRLGSREPPPSASTSIPWGRSSKPSQQIWTSSCKPFGVPAIDGSCLGSRVEGLGSRVEGLGSRV